MDFGSIQLGLIAILFFASVGLFFRIVFNRDSSQTMGGGHFLWLWACGGVLLMLIEAAEQFLT